MKSRIWTPTFIKPRKRVHVMEGMGRVLSPEGDVLWQDADWMPNALMDEGEENILNDWLLGVATLSKYLCLIDGTGTPPAETDTLTYLAGAAGSGETKVPAASGYNRIQIATGDWSAPALSSGDMQSAAAEKIFGPATGAAWTASHAGLVTHLTSQAGAGGKFLLFIALSGTTTVNIGQSFEYILRAKIQ